MNSGRKRLRNYRSLDACPGGRVSADSRQRGMSWRLRTNLWQSMNADAREQLYECVGKTQLVGRVGEASEVARAYLFLMQEGYSTGQTVVLDGGAVLV
jgi:NAD(P)-dependent dehydrogenase (short-subunit alcohol dehydrogenase family)